VFASVCINESAHAVDMHALHQKNNNAFMVSEVRGRRMNYVEKRNAIMYL
jgi:hypothetical protein